MSARARGVSLRPLPALPRRVRGPARRQLPGGLWLTRGVTWAAGEHAAATLHGRGRSAPRGVRCWAASAPVGSGHRGSGRWVAEGRSPCARAGGALRVQLTRWLLPEVS